MIGDQAEGLRRLFSTSSVTLTVEADETAMIDAYAQIKRIARERGCNRFMIAISRARNATEARNVFDSMQRVAETYLGVRLEYLGMTNNETASPAVMRARRGPGRSDSVL